jgi:hypothetical protein
MPVSRVAWDYYGLLGLGACGRLGQGEQIFKQRSNEATEYAIIAYIAMSTTSYCSQARDNGSQARDSAAVYRDRLWISRERYAKPRLNVTERSATALGSRVRDDPRKAAQFLPAPMPGSPFLPE